MALLMIHQFSPTNYQSICDELASKDPDLQKIIDDLGYPNFWSRTNSFESLVHIILEQQVSLASANSALNKLKESVQEITPTRILLLTDEEMRACYVSRQKNAYIRYLAEAILSGQINLEEFTYLPDDEIRAKLVALKGIGNWTVDVYLISALHRADIFPIGDLAAVNALKRVKGLPKETPSNQLMSIIDNWKPYRTLAAKLLWHYYLTSPKPASPPKKKQ
jgi:DNA-3-methyladenine glycosylase II